MVYSAQGAAVVLRPVSNLLFISKVLEKVISQFTRLTRPTYSQFSIILRERYCTQSICGIYIPRGRGATNHAVAQIWNVSASANAHLKCVGKVRAGSVRLASELVYCCPAHHLQTERTDYDFEMRQSAYRCYHGTGTALVRKTCLEQLMMAAECFSLCWISQPLSIPENILSSSAAGGPWFVRNGLVGRPHTYRAAWSQSVLRHIYMVLAYIRCR